MTAISAFIAGLPSAAVPFNGTEELCGIQNGGNVSFSPRALSLASITRAEIPTTKISQTTFTVDGYSTHGDLGTGAIYTSNGATANSFGAIQDITGTWFQLIANGPINVGWFGAVNDGVTDNSTAFQALRAEMPKLNPGAEQTVTVTIASPAVFTLVDHGLQPGTPVRFTTNGALPTGITAGQLCFVTIAGLTKDTFGVSNTNMGIAWFSGDQPRINTSGSQSGAHSIVVSGQEWIEVLMPPGRYHFAGPSGSKLTQNGCMKVRVFAYGAIVDGFSIGGQTFWDGVTGAFDSQSSALFNTVSTGANSNQITLTSLADVSKFNIGQWVYLSALDTQGVVSYPPNNMFIEFNKITAINTLTGVITFQNRLRSSYRSTYPAYGDVPGTTLPTGGPARIYAMHFTWPVQIEVFGLRDTEAAQHYPSGLFVRLIDCTDDGQGSVPTMCKTFLAERHTFTGALEVDKGIEFLKFKECTAPQIFLSSAGSIDQVVFEGCNIDLLHGTARLTRITDSTCGEVTVGPLALGLSEAVLIEDSRISSFSPSLTLADQAIGALSNLIEFWSFSDGTFSAPLTSFGGNAPVWAVPGGKYFVKNLGGGLVNWGSPFAILDVRGDGTNVYLDTTLVAKPTGSSTKSTATMTIASPVVVTWNAHGLTANTPITFLTTGALPTGVTKGNLYFVLAAGLTANTFRFSASVGGPAINTSGTQSGTHTAVANPLMFTRHQCSRLTVRNSTGSAIIAALSMAPDEAPLFTYSERFYVKDSASPSGAGAGSVVQQIVQGKLVSLSINVTQAYTGVLGALTLALTATGYNDSLLPSNLSQTIDLKTTGLRTITQTGTTGGVGADSIAAYAGWIADSMTALFSADIGSEAVVKMPIFEIIAETDQNITQYNVIQTNTTQDVLISDTNTSSEN